jgi:hypothetical protein
VSRCGCSSSSSTELPPAGPSTLTPGLSLHNAQPLQRCALTPAHPSTLSPASVCSTECHFNSALGLQPAPDVVPCLPLEHQKPLPQCNRTPAHSWTLSPAQPAERIAASTARLCSFDSSPSLALFQASVFRAGRAGVRFCGLLGTQTDTTLCHSAPQASSAWEPQPATARHHIAPESALTPRRVQPPWRRARTRCVSASAARAWP